MAIDRDVGIAVAATTAVFSPRAREVMRKGAVYGLAGVLRAGDVVVSTAQGAARGANQGVKGGSQNSARASRSRSRPSSGSRGRGRAAASRA